MNDQNSNQLPYRAFAPPAIQGQPDRRSTGSSSSSSVVSCIRNVLSSNGTSSATIRQAYRLQGSPADFIPPSAGSPSSHAPATNFFASILGQGQGNPVNLCGPTLQTPNTSDTLMVVATVLVPDRQPPPSLRVSQNGTGNGGHCPPPMIPVTNRRSVTSSYPVSACSSNSRYSSCVSSLDIPVAQQGAPSGIIRSSPMTPVFSHSSVSSDGSFYSAVESSTTGFTREDWIYSNGPVFGSCHTPLNSEVLSSASREYGSERSYGSSGASFCGIFCFNCSGNRNPKIRPGADGQSYCLYCLKPTRRRIRRLN